LVESNIREAFLGRPARLSATGIPSAGAAKDQVMDMMRAGLSAHEAGRMTVRGINENSLYVFTHPEFKEDLVELDAGDEGGLDPCAP
jgi:hypothetical protein